MRFVVWIFFLLVLGLVGSLALRVISRSGDDPRDNYARAERLHSGPQPDLSAALDELDYALRVARAEEDMAAEGPFHDLIGDILTLRGQIYSELGMLGQARTDLENVLDDFRPDDIEVQIKLAGVLIESEEIDASMLLLNEVLGRDPARADAWTLQSRALVQRAEEKLAEAAEECQSALPDAKSRTANVLLDRSSGLPVSHPRRVMMLHMLRELFGPLEEANARNALGLADQASEYVSEARAALAESFRDKPSRDSLFDFLTLLERSGRDDLTIDFGLAAINQSQAQGNHTFLRVLMQSLLDEGRSRTAVDVVINYFPHESRVHPDKDFYATWAQALYEDERWHNLVFVGNQMMRASGDDAGRSRANYFIGISLAREGKFAEALIPLQKFTGRVPVEPVPGALPLAWKMIARCMREKGLVPEEKAALRGALRLAPEKLEGAAEDWLRLAQLITDTEEASLPDALDALTHCMRLEPERTPGLIGRWNELGAKILAGSRAELELIYSRLVSSGLLVPEGRTSPYELYQLALRHQTDGRPAGVAACARKLLNAYPGFRPAVDLYVEAALEMNDRELAARVLYGRILQAGPDPETVAQLDALTQDSLDVEHRLKLMRLDPDYTGRMAVVRALREEGRSFEALVGLEQVAEEQMNDRSRFLKAQVAYDLRRWGLTRENVEALTPESEFYVPGLHLQLDVAVRSRDREALPGLVETLVTRDAPDVDALIEVADEMLLGRLTEEARSLLTQLDERDETRNGQVILRRAMAAWLEDDLPATDEHLARAEAFLTNGAPEIGLLIRAVDRREWHELPWLVVDLQAADFTPTLLQAAVLDALREDTQSAERLVAQGRRKNPEEKLWEVVERALDLLVGRPPESAPSCGEDELVYSLIGHGRGERDPRQLLVRLLALEHADWGVFVTAEQGRLRVPKEGSLWANYITARGLELHGDLEAAENRAREALDHWETFEPAWDLVERTVMATLDRPDRPRLLRIQQQRRRARGDREQPTSVPDLRVRARVLSEDGEHEDAMLAIEQALELEPEDPENLLVLGQLHRKSFDWKPALLAMSQATAQREPSTDDYMVGDYLELIGEALAAAPDLASVVRAELVKLEERFPDDPLVLLELARSDLDDGAVTPETRLARSLQRLTVFRERIAGTPFESLRTGSTEAWVEFYLERDPRRARELVLDQLQLLPASIDLWRMLGRTEVALGARKAAIETYETLLRMLPEGDTARAIARLLSETGEDHPRVKALIAQTAKLERGRGKDFDLQLIQARSFVNDLKSVKTRTQGISQLELLWEKRKQRADTQEQIIELGELYGLALAWRDEGNDGKLAHAILLEVEPQLEDPARRNMIRAVANLALQ
jgi:tetratricopeptide (TPR) repeat protein